MAELPFLIPDGVHADVVEEWRKSFSAALPFPHIVLDDFLPIAHAQFLSERFPSVDHPVWLDWRKRSPHQYGKQGPGNANKFGSLDPMFRLAMQEFNAAPFLEFLERLTGIEKLLPDPHFTGGGMHQILQGGILDIHTDFNAYERLGIFRRLNVLIYLTREWREDFGGELELWDGGKDTGTCVKRIAPLCNRAVIFRTDKQSFHGHPREWAAPEGITRRSIALYYYTASTEAGQRYDGVTDFQGVASKQLPEA